MCVHWAWCYIFSMARHLHAANKSVTEGDEGRLTAANKILHEKRTSRRMSRCRVTFCRVPPDAGLCGTQTCHSLAQTSCIVGPRPP
jgi:hypothetical protein